jgi:DNA-directed RNA polymerase specialized sigma24 family protein
MTATTKDEPISEWLRALRTGDDEAATYLWKHFADKLCAAVRRRIRLDTRRLYDEDDAAQSAFHSLCRGVSQGQFPDLNDRDSLWRLLLVIALRKVNKRHRFDLQERRDVRRTSGDAQLADTDEGLSSVDEISADAPSPDLAAEFVDTYELLLEQLDDEMLQRIVELKLEGFTNVEVAEKLSCTRKTVQRKLEIVRRAWQNGDDNGELQ